MMASLPTQLLVDLYCGFHNDKAVPEKKIWKDVGNGHQAQRGFDLWPQAAPSLPAS